MRHLLKFFFAVSVCSALLSPAFANEGGGEKKEEEGKKEEVKAAPPEWVEIQSRLATMKAKVSGKEKTVRELIAAKQTEKDPAKINQIVTDLKREHHEFEEAAEEYERLRNVLRYRYPEKGLKDGRSYERVEVQSLSDMEKQVGIEGRIQRTMVKVRQQYSGGQKTHEDKPQAAPAPAGRPSESRSVTEPSVMSK